MDAARDAAQKALRAFQARTEGVPQPVLASVGVVFATLLIWQLLFARREDETPVTVKWQAPLQALPGWKGLLINKPSITSHLDEPKLLRPGDRKSGIKSYITCYAPASGYHLATLPSESPAGIAAKIDKAEQAQLEWAETTFAQRRKVLRSLLKWCVEEKEAIARVASRDTGKTLVDAAFGEVLTTCEKLRWTIAYGEKHLTPQQRPTNMILAHKVSKVHYEPLGVVAAIVSWNYPFHNLISPIIASIFTGNAIVVKPSELVAWSSHQYINAIRSCIADCGFNPDIVQIVVTLPESVEALTGSPKISHITFIGSEQVGKKVAIKGAEVGTPVLLELGGKDPCVLCPSADLKYFGDTFMRGVFQASGQNCIGIERVLVSDKIYDAFVDMMQYRVSRLVQGDILAEPLDKNLTDLERTDVGAMVSDRLFGELEELIEAAVKDGARLLVGGKRYEHPKLPKGHYFQPTLLVDVLPTMAIAQQEVFAPIMTVFKYTTLNEAVELANSTRYGLGSSVFGRVQSECRWVAKRLKAGMVSTNDFGVTYLNQSLPFGGCKASGHGRFAGPEGLHGLCHVKAITEDRLHGALQTGIPPLLAYPINSGPAAWQFVGGLIAMMYAPSWAGKARGLWNLGTARE